MKRRLLLLPTLAFAMLACNTLPQPQSKALGILEVEFNSGGVSSAKFERGLKTQAVTLREADLVLGTGTTQVVSSTDAAHDYLVASFFVSHAASSTLPFDNLTFYALAKNGNIGNTAIKTITNFGGVVSTAEQTRLAKHLVPVHPVYISGGDLFIDFYADFQAFTPAEVTAATTASSSLLSAGDTILNYGFTARCSECGETREIPAGNQGVISFAIRVPKAAQNTAYKFVMNFVVLDEDTTRVTRSLIQNESFFDAEDRGSWWNATRLTQYGLTRMYQSTSFTNEFVDDVRTSTLGASIQALGIDRIDTTDLHSCGLNSVGLAYCWGAGGNGRLGNNSTANSNSPVAVSPPTGSTTALRFASISTGDAISCGIITSGEAYCWGGGGQGNLGGGSVNTGSRIPQAVVAPTGGSVLKFSSIGTGTDFTCGLTTAGAAYCWGSAADGKLGNGGTSGNFFVPQLVSGGLTFSSLSVGKTHACAITPNASAYCWGNGSGGKLGTGNTNNASTPAVLNFEAGFASISAGNLHTCAIASNGEGYCWGSNLVGQVGNNTFNNSYSSPVAVEAPVGSTTALLFSSISAGEQHTCGVTTSGQGYCWGNAANGRLGAGSVSGGVSLVPIAVGAPSGGSVLTFSSINAANFHSCGVTTTGVAYCWGDGFNGKLGTGNTTSSTVPVAVLSTLYNL